MRRSARAGPRRGRAADSDSPASAAIGRKRSTAARTSSVRNRPIAHPILSEAARESAGYAEAAWYFPVRTPCASGDQTICEMPAAAHRGITARSGRRHSIEYCGWLETKCSTPGMLVCRLDLCGRPFAETEIASLAGADDLGQRRHRLLERGRPRRTDGTGRGRHGPCPVAATMHRSASGSGPATDPDPRRSSGSRASSRARTSRAGGLAARCRGTLRRRHARRRSPYR